MQTGAIVLCGGRSSRMGRDKATLPFGPETMLQRVVRLLSEVVRPGNIVVVASAAQVLPPLPDDIVVTHDERPERGPLEGMATGLRALPTEVEAAYVTSCDVPLLAPAFVRQLFGALGNHDVVVPHDGGRYHPLAAVYRCGVLSRVERLLAADCLRMQSLFAEVRLHCIPVSELAPADPTLATLRNLNHPEDYEAALNDAGFPR